MEEQETTLNFDGDVVVAALMISRQTTLPIRGTSFLRKFYSCLMRKGRETQSWMSLLQNHHSRMRFERQEMRQTVNAMMRWGCSWPRSLISRETVPFWKGEKITVVTPTKWYIRVSFCGLFSAFEIVLSWSPSRKSLSIDSLVCAHFPSTNFLPNGLPSLPDSQVIYPFIWISFTLVAELVLPEKTNNGECIFLVFQAD
jgi:hypothetical protein